MKTYDELYNILFPDKEFKISLVGIGDNECNAVNAFYCKYKDAEYLNEPTTVHSKIDYNSFKTRKSDNSQILAVIAKLDNQEFYETCIESSKYHKNTSECNTFYICITSSASNSYNSNELQNYYDVIIHTDTSIESMYRPIEMMVCDMIYSTSRFFQIGIEEVIMRLNYMPQTFYVEKTYSGFDELAKKFKKPKEIITENIHNRNIAWIANIYIPTKKHNGITMTNKIGAELFYLFENNYNAVESAIQSCFQNNSDEIKISILYGEYIKDNEESSDEIELPDFLKKQ